MKLFEYLQEKFTSDNNLKKFNRLYLKNYRVFGKTSYERFVLFSGVLSPPAVVPNL